MIFTRWLVEILGNFFKKHGLGVVMSYSRMSAYAFCPYKFKIIYEDRKYSPTNAPIALGVSIHKTLEDFYKNDGRSFDDLLESYNICWVNEGFSSPQEVQDYFDKGQRILENFWTEEMNRTSKVLFVEKDFKFLLGFNTIRGIIDRVDRRHDGTYEIIDYKTHEDAWSDKRIETDIQLSIYMLGTRKVLGIKNADLTYMFLAQNKKVTVRRTEAQLADAVRKIREMSAKMLKKDYTPNTANCVKCDFRKNCDKSIVRKIER